MRSLTKYAEKAKKLPSWIYKAGSQAYIDYKFPRHIFLETTALCNLACSFCPREQNDSHMDWELFKQIVEEATQHGPRAFSLHLFGEPLLWPRILDGIEYIKKMDSRHVLHLTTNGTHLNRYVDSLIRLGTDEIIWAWRKEAKFKDQTIRLLGESTRRGTTRFRVRIIKEVTPQEEIEKWKTWPEVEIRSLHNYGGQINLSRYGVPNVETRWACYHLWLSPAVAWNGNILLCCADPHQKEVLGKYPTQTLSRVWQGKQLADIRRSHMERKYGGICRNCDVWKSTPDLFFPFQYSTSSSSGNSTLVK